LISLSNKTKGFFCFAFNRKMPLRKVPFFEYVISQKRRATQRKQLQGNVFSAKMKATCKNSADLEPKKTTKIVTYPLLL